MITLKKIDSKNFSSKLAIVTGGGFLVFGLINIIFYIVSVFDVVNQANKSIIFWYLPLLFLGIILLGAGIIYLIVGIRSLKGNETAYKYSRYLIIIAGILIVIITLLTLFNNFLVNS